MKRLWIFGDSFSDGCGLEDENPYAQLKQKEFEVDSVWNLTWENLLAKDLNSKLVRRAIPGCSNTDIILQIIQNINQFQKDDSIIVGWTNPTRLSLPAYTKDTRPLISFQNDRTARWYDGEYKTTNYYDFYINTFFPNIDTHSKFWNETGREFLIHLSKLYNVKSWYWPKYTSEIETIYDETNGKLSNGHPSITGHSILKEIIQSIEWGTINEPDNKFNSDYIYETH